MPGVSPMAAATSSSGSLVRVETTIGTPVAAAARAAARSPWPSWVQSPVTPIGAMNSGLASFMPKRLMERSRVEQSTIIRGIRPQCLKAEALLSWVCSSPQPPCTYFSVEGDMAP